MRIWLTALAANCKEFAKPDNMDLAKKDEASSEPFRKVSRTAPESNALHITSTVRKVAFTWALSRTAVRLSRDVPYDRIVHQKCRCLYVVVRTFKQPRISLDML
ncbi:hypothetical protein RvY_12039 [Ramazzottius varieornatus]|uniref:Uncharacterized protein n=1 Tax=Ramazzottius varieornatus TaxID=947166 RepID=A0A1D1VME2_RAMVA|nr:hypothetical protein RvY_12039 [Ramazzottius varieornatus]